MDILSIVILIFILLGLGLVVYAQHKFTKARNFIAENIGRTHKFLTEAEATFRAQDSLKNVNMGGMTSPVEKSSYALNCVLGSFSEQLKYEQQKKALALAEQEEIIAQQKITNTAHLFTAIMMGDSKQVRLLLNSPVDVNAFDSFSSATPTELAIDLMVKEAKSYKHATFNQIAHFLSAGSQVPFVLGTIAATLAFFVWGVNAWAIVSEHANLAISLDVDSLIGFATFQFLIGFILALPSLLINLNQKINYNAGYWDKLEERTAIVQLLFNNSDLNWQKTGLNFDDSLNKEFTVWIRSRDIHTQAALRELVYLVQHGKYELLTHQ